MKDILVWGLGLLGTMVGPYGWRVWQEVWMQISDRELRRTIAEWLPFYMILEPAFWMLGVLLVFLIGKYFRKRPWWQSTTALGLLAAGISGLRHIGLLAVAAVPVLAGYFGVFTETELKDDLAKERARRIYLGLVAMTGILFVIPIIMEIQQGGIGDKFYPTAAVEFLKNNEISGNVLSEYGWGGYLIWKYPEKKVFIDGRMPSWRWSAYAKASAGKSAPEGESNWAMKDYIKVWRDGEYGEIFAKYEIKTVLLPVEGKGLWWEEGLKKIETVIRKKLGEEKLGKKSLAEKLISAGWRKSFEDKTSTIYQAP
jgi:hypothetical protein